MLCMRMYLLCLFFQRRALSKWTLGCRLCYHDLPNPYHNSLFQGSLLPAAVSASKVLPSKGLLEQDFDEFISFSLDKMTETVSGPETILSMESSSSKSTYELSPPLTDLPLIDVEEAIEVLRRSQFDVVLHSNWVVPVLPTLYLRQPHHALRRLIADELLKAQVPQSNLSDAIFVPNPHSSETPILGPAFDKLPLALTVHYPIFEECQILRDIDDLDWVHWSRKNSAVPPITSLKRKRHTRALVSIPEVSTEPKKTLSSLKRRKALIPDSDDETAGYSGLVRKRPSHRSSSAQPSNTSSSHQSPSHRAPIIEPISEENLDTMVDLYQVGNPWNSFEPSNLDDSNIEHHVDYLSAVPEILPLKPLETSNSQLLLEEANPLETHSSEATAHIVQEEITPVEFEGHSFCNRICLPVQPPVVLNPVNELTVLLNPPSNLKPSFSQEETQELVEICQLWDQFEICCQALAHLKPNNSKLSQRLQHMVSNIRSDFPYIQDFFQERGALQLVERDMDNLHSQALSIQTSYRESTSKLQTLRVQEEALLKSLADVRQNFLESTAEVTTFELTGQRLL
ncbi:hypothetical protein RHSIM_Rhsim11G0015300 [Rhododendron simsii]|uniref:Uncharacterized protein n=1 Tax=Rhododendron simsii TaxID=118357 RepID=A0A834GCM3_RHOSS|nr:hypothetical protein RHSIM_Rhsim11G0015300 [Rhododendron simsii]